MSSSREHYGENIFIIFIEALVLMCVVGFTATYRLLKSANIELYFSGRLLGIAFAVGIALTVGWGFKVDLRPTSAGWFDFSFSLEFIASTFVIRFFFSLFFDSGEDSSGT